MNRSARRASGIRTPVAELAYPCTHCSTERLVCTIAEFIGFNRRHPLPGLDQPLAALLRLYGPDERVSMCPGCFCLTAELYGPHTD